MFLTIMISVAITISVAFIVTAYALDKREKEFKDKYDRLETKYLQLSHYHYQLEEDYRKHIYEKH